MKIDKDRILYKKNSTFSIKHIVTTVENLDIVTKEIENGLHFDEVLLKNDEVIDIIDINYLHNKDKLHIILHFAIIKLVS